MKHNFYCEHGRILLRPLEYDDIEWVRNLRNQPQIRKWFNFSEEISEQDQRNWYEKYLEDETDFMYIASLKSAPDIPIGTYADYNYDRVAKTIEAGRLMVDSRRVKERGLGYDVVGCAAKLAFENLPISKITAEIYADNERSIKCTAVGGGFHIVNEVQRQGHRIYLLEVTRAEYESKILNKA